jgi:hypothetical protein
MLLVKSLLVVELHELQVLKKAKLSSVSRVALAIVFWNAKGVVLVDIIAALL